VEWYDGSGWNKLESTQDTSWFPQEKTSGTGADSNADFKVRIHINANKTGEYARMDDVEITDTPQ
jgi:hypothetical protein